MTCRVMKITWEKVDNFTYPVFDKWPSDILWVMMALDIGESLITSRGSLTFKRLGMLIIINYDTKFVGTVRYMSMEIMKVKTIMVIVSSDRGKGILNWLTENWLFTSLRPFLPETLPWRKTQKIENYKWKFFCTWICQVEYLNVHKSCHILI